LTQSVTFNISFFPICPAALLLRAVAVSWIELNTVSCHECLTRRYLETSEYYFQTVGNKHWFKLSV